MLQVVLRDGMPIDAEVPDYRELDEVPAKPQNVPVQRQPTSCAQNLYNSQANGAQCNGTSQAKSADHVRIQVGHLCGQQSLVCLALLQCTCNYSAVHAGQGLKTCHSSNVSIQSYPYMSMQCFRTWPTIVVIHLHCWNLITAAVFFALLKARNDAR